MDADGPKSPPGETPPKLSEHPTPTEIVVRRLWELRKRKGLSGAVIAQRMTQLGIPWDRNTVAKLESKRRQSINVDELMALAYVLEESPLALLLPAEPSAYFIAPSVRVSMAEAYMWIIGDLELPETSAPDRSYERQFARLAFHRALPWAIPPTEGGVAWANDPTGAADAELKRLLTEVRDRLRDLPPEQRLAAIPMKVNRDGDHQSNLPTDTDE